MENIGNYILGETDDLISLESSDQNRAVAIHMINGCRRYVNIVSRDLDPCIYDNVEIVNAIKKLALRSRLSQVRILILKPDAVRSQSHRLIELSMKLSSFIEIRRTSKKDHDYHRAIMTVDGHGYLRRPHSDRFEGQANFNDGLKVTELINEFNYLWERSKVDPNFRQLAL